MTLFVFTSIPLISQDSPGLEILDPLNQWKLVPCVPGTFVVNTGTEQNDLLSSVIFEKELSPYIHRIYSTKID